MNYCAPENFGDQFPSLVGPMGPPGGPGTYVENFALLRLLDPTVFVQGYMVNVGGHTSALDGGGGIFAYDSTSVASDNDGTIIQPAVGPGAWYRQYDGAVHAKWFGAKIDGVTNDTAAAQGAIDFVESLNGGCVLFSPGKCLCNVTVEANNVTLDGTATSRVELDEGGLMAFDPTLPTVTIGDGVTIVFQNVIKNIGVNGKTTAGINSPAAVRWKSAANCSVSNFSFSGGQKTVHFENSATQPVTCIYLANGQIRADYPNAAGRGFLVKRAAGSYTTGVSFANVHFNGQQFGHIGETDTEVVYFANCYFDIYAGFGLFIGVNGGGYHGANCVLDCPAGVALKVSENVRNISRYITGFWRADAASIQYLDTTTAFLGYTLYADSPYIRNLKAVGDATIDGAATVGATLGVTGLSTLGSTKIGVGTAITKVLSTTGPLDFPLVAAGSAEVLTIPLVGAAVGAAVLVTLADAGGPYSSLTTDGWVSAADVVSVRAINFSAAGLNPAGQTYRVVVFNF